MHLIWINFFSTFKFWNDSHILYHMNDKILFIKWILKVKDSINNYCVQYILTSKNNADIIFKIKSKNIVTNVNNGHILFSNEHDRNEHASWENLMTTNFCFYFSAFDKEFSDTRSCQEVTRISSQHFQSKYRNL